MSYSNGPRIVTDGLVLCLDAANSKSYPGSGTVWSDLSGNNYNGTLTNGPTYASSYRGGITFDGTNDYINIPNSITFGSISFTLSIWFKMLAQNNATGFITSQTVDPFNTNGKGIQLRFRIYGTNTMEYAINDGSGTTNRLLIYNNNLNTVYNITIVHNYNGIAYAYQNNILNNSYDFSGEGNSSYSDTPDLWLCRGGNGYSNVEVYNFSVYNKALSESERSQNYNALKGRFSL